MSLTFIRSALVAGVLAASLLGAGIASADDDVPADAPAEAVASEMTIDGEADDADFSYADASLMSKATLENALTTVLSGCRSGLLATKVAVVRNEIDPSSGYILMSEVSEFGRTSLEKLDASVMESCFKAMDMSTVDKTALDTALETIMAEMEALLAMP